MSDERPEGLSERLRKAGAEATIASRMQPVNGSFRQMIAGWAELLLSQADHVDEQSIALARLREQELSIKEALRDTDLASVPVAYAVTALVARHAEDSRDYSLVVNECEKAEAEVTRLREERDRLLEALGTIQRTTFSGHGMSEDYRSGNHDAHVTCARWATAALSSPSASEKSPKAV